MSSNSLTETEYTLSSGCLEAEQRKFTMKLADKKARGFLLITVEVAAGKSNIDFGPGSW